MQWKIWWLAARPRTLIVSVSPVLIGTTFAMQAPTFSLVMLFFTLLTAIAIQVGTNLANDYFDYLKGADTGARKGPLRVVQAGLISHKTMQIGILSVFSFAVLTGLYLIAHGGMLMIPLLSVSILSGLMYTAGPYPLAYLGLGECFVFLFFGPIAIGGTYYLQAQAYSSEAFIAGIGTGAISCTLLMVNNMRDIEEDRYANKKTLSVRLGMTFSRWVYTGTWVLAFAMPLYFVPQRPFASLPLIMALPTAYLLNIVWRSGQDAPYNSLLVKTVQIHALYTLLFCIGWLL